MAEFELLSLEPISLWKYFNELRKIPRCSQNEEKVADFIFTKAKNLGFDVFIDDMKNILVKIPASTSYENKTPICLQAHMDMVCEKNSNVVHDFSMDPIDIYIAGDYVKTRGTTLGADNGIGLAAMLALMEDRDCSHPPLELLFTVCEELGLAGAIGLNEGLLEARKLINLDGEEEGVVFIGCAGGGDTEFYFPVKRVPVENEGLHIKLHGLKGGHSGVDIHLGRANAIKLLVRTLYQLTEMDSFGLSNISGGNKRNAIPREAEALIVIKDIVNAKKLMKKSIEDFKTEYEGIEDNISIEINVIPVSEVILDGKKVIRLLLALPHGVLTMNPFLEELVDTSTNLAVVQTSEETVEIYHKTRSSFKSAIKEYKDVFDAIGKLAGVDVVQKDGYPAWKPNIKSPLLKIAKETYQNMYNRSLKVKAVHGGLETAVIGGKYPGMDMISIGPTLNYPHSPAESVQISSVKKFYDFLKQLLEII